MAHFKNTYLGNLRTESIHLRSGTRIITDAPVDNHGKGESFSPTDLVCAALASCKMTIMGIIANREGIDLTGLTCEVEKIMAANPRRIAEIRLTFELPGKTLSEKHRTMLINAANTCPVALSLDPNIKRVVTYNF
ncbi:MAG: OsmC family protein [Cytophagales bacterium]|nr:OsmC family protein [Bernardetiaceae bacterium]MDW8210764.1 OsmC family protein [Cytophagales bacterium]